MPRNSHQHESIALADLNFDGVLSLSRHTG